MSHHRPPGTPGIPYLGETIAILRDPYLYGHSHYQAFGPIFRTTFLGAPTTIMLGAEAQRYVLVEHPEYFHWRQGYAPLYSLFGEALFLTDGPEHDDQRRAVMPAFHTRVLESYLERINHTIEQQLDGWGSRGRRSIFAAAHQLAFLLASSLLVGIEPGDAQVSFAHLWDVFSGGMGAITRTNLPFTRFGRSMQASHRLDHLLQAFIETRRQTPTDDAFGLLLQARTEDGSGLTDEQLIAQIKILIFAGYTSTATTMTWLLSSVLQHPEIFKRLQDEVRAVGIPQTFQDFRALPYLDATIKETLRLYPQSYVIPRGVHVSCQVGGYDIPAGGNVMLIPAYTHRMAEYFTAPDQFSPERFLPPLNEHLRTPFAWIGFGGGSRVCLGERLAQLEIVAFIAHLITRFDLELVPDQDFTPQYQGQNRPKSAVLVTYQAR